MGRFAYITEDATGYTVHEVRQLNTLLAFTEHSHPNEKAEELELLLRDLQKTMRGLRSAGRELCIVEKAPKSPRRSEERGKERILLAKWEKIDPDYPPLEKMHQLGVETLQVKVHSIDPVLCIQFEDKLEAAIEEIHKLLDLEKKQTKPTLLSPPPKSHLSREQRKISLPHGKNTTKKPVAKKEPHKTLQIVEQHNEEEAVREKKYQKALQWGKLKKETQQSIKEEQERGKKKSPPSV